MESKIPIYDDIEKDLENDEETQSNLGIEEPNEITYKAMEDAENRKDVYGPFNSVEELMASLNS